MTGRYWSHINAAALSGLPNRVKPFQPFANLVPTREILAHQHLTCVVNDLRAG